jgi:hypothetical protein
MGSVEPSTGAGDSKLCPYEGKGNGEGKSNRAKAKEQKQIPRTASRAPNTGGTATTRGTPLGMTM